jgi:mannose-1-phosphate guanylyltransferase
MCSIFDQGNKLWNTDKEVNFINKNYSKAENISIDYGIMEGANNVYVLPVDFGWNDLGTWGSLFEKLEKDKDNNAVVNAKTLCIDAKENIIRTQKNKKVIVQGLSDYIIVETDSTILIYPKSQEQNIKQIASEVKNKLVDN